ncbi:MAG: hypothetical protein H6595_07780 [Flavobacteriales bacterium]|nr:hypothetical protein [Flavobacteriales bacterium]MCB9167365.1 hypothetical protein [Flavobacteriales bacterium]
MRKLNRFMEHFWLAVAIGTGLSAIWAIWHYGWEEGRQWLWFPGIALGMWGMRRITRRKLEAMDARSRGE